MIVCRIVSILAGFREIEQKERVYALVVVKRLDADIVKTEPEGGAHCENEKGRTNDFFKFYIVSLNRIINCRCWRHQCVATVLLFISTNNDFIHAENRLTAINQI